MTSVGRHKNITLLSLSEVEKVEGYVGNFNITARKKARYVKEDLCTGCATCSEKCPWKKVPSKFDLGLGVHPAIYFPFAQAVPRVPVIDTEYCAYFQKGKCRACEKFCPRNAIDFNQQDELLEFEVGAIILATGFQDFQPAHSIKYSYGSLDNVLTGMEFERLINSGGPTSGQLKLKDGRKPERIAILHCVGSRDPSNNEYCSRVCCMYSLKLAHLVRDTVRAEVIEFFRDMRTFGKGYEAFYERVAHEGVKFIRFDRDIQVSAGTNGQNEQLIVEVTDVYSGDLRKEYVDMVILATGMEPQSDQANVARTFGISRSPDGFFLERHPKLAPIETMSDGIFLAGACQGPKDIPDSVAQGGAAACAALALMDAGSVTLEPFTAYIDPDFCSGCKTCLNLCPYSAIETVLYDGKNISQVNEVLCKGCGTCVASCPSNVAIQYGFTQGQIFAEILGILGQMS
jgi:heterodisulfide reductase subunit A